MNSSGRSLQNRSAISMTRFTARWVGNTFATSCKANSSVSYQYQYLRFPNAMSFALLEPSITTWQHLDCLQ